MSEALWVDDDAVRRALLTGDERELDASGVPYGISADRTYCVPAREHDAWLVPGQGWREANNPPGFGRVGRLVLNFCKVRRGEQPGLWFKTPVPTREGRVRIEPAGDGGCRVRGDVTELLLRFQAIDRLMWDVLTGHAQSEHEIEDAWSRLGITER